MAVEYKNNIPKITKDLEKILQKSADELGIKGVAEVENNTPVKSGTLSKSWSYKVNNQSGNYSVAFGTSIKYAPWVEFKPNRSKGFFRGTKPTLKRYAEDILKKKLSQL